MPTTTPPHHPTYGVYLSEVTIHSIVSLVCPERTLRNVQQLESGKSFNNRIYFLTYEKNGLCRENKIQAEMFDIDHVLKVSGQFWGAEKAQNEVSCLLLLERYCPAVPAPRVVAYSENGIGSYVLSRSRSDGRPEAVQHHAHLRTITENQPHPWILMTRCPDVRLEATDLHGDRGIHIVKQIALQVSQWRHQIPRMHQIGNLRISDSSNEDPGHLLDTFPGIPPLQVSGLLQCASKPPGIISTPLEYFRIQLQDQLTTLETNENFAANRESLVPIVRNFIDHTLSKLSLFRGEPHRAIFTHNDLSPRNILVSKSGIITGILDFEFAGFFPVEEDFTNNIVHGRDDWPVSTDEVLFTELERLDVETSLHGFDKSTWQEAKTLVEVIANIAPWYLAEGGVQGDELASALLEAGRLVEEGIAVLECG